MHLCGWQQHGLREFSLCQVAHTCSGEHESIDESSSRRKRDNSDGSRRSTDIRQVGAVDGLRPELVLRGFSKHVKKYSMLRKGGTEQRNIPPVSKKVVQVKTALFGN